MLSRSLANTACTLLDPTSSLTVQPGANNALATTGSALYRDAAAAVPARSGRHCNPVSPPCWLANAAKSASASAAVAVETACRKRSALHAGRGAVSYLCMAALAVLRRMLPKDLSKVLPAALSPLPPIEPAAAESAAAALPRVPSSVVALSFMAAGMNACSSDKIAIDALKRGTRAAARSVRACA